MKSPILKAIFRSAYNYLEHEVFEIDCKPMHLDPVQTVQSEKDSCDVNLIMDRYMRTGALPSNIRPQGQFIDTSAAVPYDQALNLIRAAKEAFLELPESSRKAFGHDPLAFVEACSSNDPEVVKKLVDLGLAELRGASVEDLLNKIAINTEAAKKPLDNKSGTGPT